MKHLIYLFIFFTILSAKDISRKIDLKNNQYKNIISLNGSNSDQESQDFDMRTVRDDTNTVWLQDFEGDLSDWTIESGWELTEEQSYSTSHSFYFDDDNLEAVSSLTSPTLSVPALQSENEILKFYIISSCLRCAIYKFLCN